MQQSSGFDCFGYLWVKTLPLTKSGDVAVVGKVVMGSSLSTLARATVTSLLVTVIACNGSGGEVPSPSPNIAETVEAAIIATAEASPKSTRRSTPDPTIAPPSPSEILPTQDIAATVQAANYAGLDDRGVVRAGAVADLVLLSANPLEAFACHRILEGARRAGPPVRRPS